MTKKRIASLAPVNSGILGELSKIKEMFVRKDSYGEQMMASTSKSINSDCLGNPSQSQSTSGIFSSYKFGNGQVSYFGQNRPKVPIDKLCSIKENIFLEHQKTKAFDANELAQPVRNSQLISYRRIKPPSISEFNKNSLLNTPEVSSRVTRKLKKLKED